MICLNISRKSSTKYTINKVKFNKLDELERSLNTIAKDVNLTTAVILDAETDSIKTVEGAIKNNGGVVTVDKEAIEKTEWELYELTESLQAMMLSLVAFNKIHPIYNKDYMQTPTPSLYKLFALEYITTTDVKEKDGVLEFSGDIRFKEKGEKIYQDIKSRLGIQSLEDVMKIDCENFNYIVTYEDKNKLSIAVIEFIQRNENGIKNADKWFGKCLQCEQFRDLEKWYKNCYGRFLLPYVSEGMLVPLLASNNNEVLNAAKQRMESKKYQRIKNATCFF